MRKLFPVLALLLIAGCRSATGAVAPPAHQGGLLDSKSRRILFVGNSLTYFNMMPVLFEQIAGSRGIDVHARVAVRGGATLKWHWTSDDVQRALANQRIDVIVIQPMSSEIITNPDDTRRYASLIADAARARGAQVVLYAPWPPKAMLAEQDQFVQRYRDLATSIRAHTAPVLAAWQDVRSHGTELYNPDGLHPNLAGSYLAAAVLFATIFDRDPAGAIHTFEVRFSDESEDVRALIHERIDDAEAAALQRAAWDAVEHERLRKPAR